MKRFLIGFAVIVGGISAANAQAQVDGYYKSNGTYVQPHYRSSPNSSYNDNWSTRGNTNPYTGSSGTHSPTYNDRTPSYNSNTYGSPLYAPQPRY